MFDGLKILNLSVPVDRLLTGGQLVFPLPVDEQTGSVFTDRLRRATDRGLTFTLVPTRADPNQYRVELAGSLHRYSRGGLHNADDFSATHIAAAVEELVSSYCIDAHRSTLNNVEFGVNLVLPFPVAYLLRALICYKGVPFQVFTNNGFAYYQATLQQYAVKVYDKGQQYGLTDHMLRFEVKVLKMHYLHRQGIQLVTLADLLNQTHYLALGKLLANTFDDILFDEPSLRKEHVPDRHRELLLEGRNPRFWQRPEPKQPDYTQRRKQQQRDEKRFKGLLAAHRLGSDWQGQTATLLREKWVALSATSTTAHRETIAANCPKLTGASEVVPPGELSQINPLYVPLNRDYSEQPTWLRMPFCETPKTVRKQRQRGGIYYENNKRIDRSTVSLLRGKDRPTATTLKANNDLLNEVERGRKQYAKGSKEKRAFRAAHLLRNDESNPRNNLRRSINKIYRQPVLFDVATTLRLTDNQRATLDYWQGTRWEVHQPRQAN